MQIMETLLQEAKDANAALRETIAEKESELSAKADDVRLPFLDAFLLLLLQALSHASPRWLCRADGRPGRAN